MLNTRFAKTNCDLQPQITQKESTVCYPPYIVTYLLLLEANPFAASQIPCIL
jgi:hypothetical protein